MACSGGRRSAAAGDAAHDELASEAGQAVADARGDRVADLLRLVPDVAGQGLVGPFAGQRDLVSLLVHRLGQPQQGRARGIEHRPLGGPDQLGKRVGDPRPIHGDGRQAASPALGRPRSHAARSSGPALSSPTVKAGIASPRWRLQKPRTTVESSPPLM